MDLDRYARYVLDVFAQPPGFYEIAVLSARAAWVAQKPVRTWCAPNADAWQQYLTTSGDTAVDVEGATPFPGAGETYFAPDVCAVIRARLRKRTVNLPTLGAALDVVAHESFHMRGLSDEGQTECSAYRSLPAYLVARWGFRKGSPAYAQVMYGATNYHDRLPPIYRTVC